MGGVKVKIRKEELLNKLSKISGVKYTDSTKIRNSVLDNTFYNYSAGKYMGDTDFSEVPYLTVGSAFGGLVSSVLEFEASGVNLIFDKSEFENTNAKDYNYLLASEAGSAPVVHFNNSKVDGIIWNEGNVERVVEGRPDGRSSKVTVYFNNSKFAYPQFMAHYMRSYKIRLLIMRESQGATRINLSSERLYI